MSEPDIAAPGLLQALLIEDNPGDAWLTLELLDEAGAAIQVTHVTTLAAGLDFLAEEEAGVVLLDLSLPDARGLDTVRRLRHSHPRVPLIVLSGRDDQQIAVEALQNGAQDYLIKGRGDGDAIARAVRYAVERKRAELELIEAKELAEASSRAKSSFLAHMSHELRTPLNHVIGFSDIIANGKLDPAPDEVCRQYAGYINTSGRHLLDLLSQILDLSKSLGDHLALHEEEIDLPSLLCDCVDAFYVRAAQKKIALVLTAPPEIAPLIADKSRLRQVVSNLLSNAVKFSSEGTVVEIACAHAGDGNTVITVRDFGIGIEPQDIPIALEPFRQLENEMTAHEGAGIGLPLAKLIVEEHGGTLSIASAVGAGTTVSVCLPAWRLRLSAEDTAPRRAATGRRAASG